MHSEENLNSEFQTKKDLPKFHSSSVTYKDIYTGKYKNDHWSIPYLFECKPRLIKLLSSFYAAYNNQGWLTFLSISYARLYMTLSLSLATFC